MKYYCVLIFGMSLLASHSVLAWTYAECRKNCSEVACESQETRRTCAVECSQFSTIKNTCLKAMSEKLSIYQHHVPENPKVKAIHDFGHAIETRTLMIDQNPKPGHSFGENSVFHDTNFENDLHDMNDTINNYYKTKHRDRYVKSLENLISVSFVYHYSPMLARMISASKDVRKSIQTAQRSENWMTKLLVSANGEWLINSMISKQIRNTMTFAKYNGIHFNDLYFETYSNLILFEDAEGYEGLLKKIREDMPFLWYQKYFLDLTRNEEKMGILLRRRWEMLNKTFQAAKHDHAAMDRFAEALEVDGCLISLENNLQLLLATAMPEGQDEGNKRLYQELSAMDGLQIGAQFILWLLNQYNSETAREGIDISLDVLGENSGFADEAGIEKVLSEIKTPGQLERYSKFYEMTLKRSVPSITMEEINTLTQRLTSVIIPNLEMLY